MKKIISIMLLLFMIVGIAIVPVAATTLNEGSPDAVVEAKLGVGTKFTVTIPATTTITGEGEATNPFKITVDEPLLPYGTELKVKTTYDGKMKLADNEEVSLGYKLFTKGEKSDTEIPSESIALRVPSGTKGVTEAEVYGKLTEKPTFAGDYSSQIMFKILVEDIVTLYTPEEIEANPRLFGIGKTKRDYVVAEFNEDFSSVNITKNGDKSDGIMEDWIKPGNPIPNPMYNNKATLKTVDIKSGVKSVGDYAFMRCSNLTGSLILPNTVERVGDAAFRYASNLTGLTLNDNLKVIGKGAFSYCQKITGPLNIPDKVTFVGDWAFDRDEGFDSLNLGKSVEYLGNGAFQACRGFKNKLVLPNKLFAMGDFCFGHCNNFTNQELVIPASVKHIGGFYANKLNGDTPYDEPDKTPENFKIANYYKTGTHTFCDFAGASIKMFTVEEGNTEFKSVDGCLLSKDGKRFIHYPTQRVSPENTYQIPEGVETIDEIAGFSPKFVVLPDSFTIKSYKDSPLTQLNFENNLCCAMYCNQPILRVKPTNTKYVEENDIIYSKDGTICYYIPTNVDNLAVREGCTTLEGAMFGFDKDHKKNGGPFTITIPKTVTKITNDNDKRYPTEGTLNNFNHAVDNPNIDFTVIVAPENPNYEVDSTGHLVEKVKTP